MLKRRELTYVSLQSRNHKRPFKQYVESSELKDYRYASSKQYYPYNMDVHDSGWGCAWRCIQMLLSEPDVPFEQMFNVFGNRDALLQLYAILYPTKLKERAALEQKKFAPHDLPNGWAEPFIAHLVLFRYQVNSELLLLNAYPPSANAPREVFDNIISFEDFRAKLIKHFQIGRGLVMIDDATYTFVIFGCKCNPNGNLMLLIGDPHISNNQVQTNTGIYQVELDAQGSQVRNSLTPEEKKCMNYASYLSLEFSSSPWMVLFAEK